VAAAGRAARPYRERRLGPRATCVGQGELDGRDKRPACPLRSLSGYSVLRRGDGENAAEPAEWLSVFRWISRGPVRSSRALICESEPRLFDVFGRSGCRSESGSSTPKGNETLDLLAVVMAHDAQKRHRHARPPALF
jgi:hypothetical protein